MSDDAECDSPGMIQVKGFPSRQRTQPTNQWAPRFETSDNETNETSTLEMDCQGENFLDCWHFFNETDPTDGYVQYVSRDEALGLGLVHVTNTSSVYVGSLFGQNAPVKSVRLHTNKVFQEGHIFVIDVKHVPVGMGTWPAFWSYGPFWPKWPTTGEMDIIETVHIDEITHQTLHTSWGCFMPLPGISDPNCNGNYGKSGCDLAGPPNSGGPSLNAGGGGVFATQWTHEGIKMWVFPRGKVPQDLVDDEPDSALWGDPANFFPFGQNCPSTHFRDQVLVLNLDWCGEWAGGTFPEGGEWKCEEFVKDPANIDQLKDAFWEINYVKVFAPEPKMAKSKTKMNAGKSMSSRGSMKGKGEKTKEIKKNDKSKKQQKSDNTSKKQLSRRP